ncbi:phosphotransferase [cf. Phormidesmis sp. LEGE 11477]|uniref:phosphotransferase n=1 Tax=cf. Phormidesmis sp. LEGE 11477 TaxID=1828680 RepID=UPI001881FDB6|nr:phosphotransferase [cf. Phormidesmis sp. LEGE 11477]MBE9063803.1 phosphotransferase [cf. Phormidesmis sp. LEGE 11477]
MSSLPHLTPPLEKLKLQLAQALADLPVAAIASIDQAEANQAEAADTEAAAEATDLKLLAHGEANAIFRLNQDRLVRVAINTPNQRFGGDFSQLSSFEAAILNYLKGTGISQELLHAQTTPSNEFPYTYLITNYLSGKPLNYSRPHLQRCAHTLAQLHRLPLEKGYESVDWLCPPVQRVEKPLTLFFQESWDYAQPYLDSADADPDIVRMLQDVLAKAKQRLPLESQLLAHPHVCLVHSDHTYENWVINDQKAFLIDWEWAEIGSPAGDLGHFLSPVTVRRYQDYRLPAADRQFFLTAYYDALNDAELAKTMQIHFAAFGAFPAVRSLCWTAGYWVTANRWYANEKGASATERMARLQKSQQQFSELWAEVMDLLEVS